MTNVRISQLQNRISYYLRSLDRRLDVVESEISNLYSEISDLEDQISDMRDELSDIESKLVSVVYPCGEGNSEEILLKTQDGLVAYFQRMRTETIRFRDTITIDEYEIPGHYDKFCVDTNFFNGECREFDYRYVSGSTIPSSTYRVADTARVRVLSRAYLDVLADGSYRTTDGFSCNFEIEDGELVEGGN